MILLLCKMVVFLKKVNMQFASYEKGDKKENGERETTDEGTTA